MQKLKLNLPSLRNREATEVRKLYTLIILKSKAHLQNKIVNN